MTTSNSTDFTQTRDQIIADALSLLGRLGEGETPTTNALSFCSNILNKLIKQWETQLHLWTTSEGTVFCNPGQNTYRLSPTGDYACDDTTLVTNQITTASSGSSCVVTSTTGINVGDTIGIELDTGTRFWTTVASVPNSTTVNLVGSMTGTASVNNTVFSYTSNIGRPIDIRSARRRIGIFDSESDNEIRMTGRSDFMGIVNKNTPGFPNRGFYTAQRDQGILYVWPTPDDCTTRIQISYARSIQDFDTGTDTPDLPQEWLFALTYNLARAAAPAYGINLTKSDPNDIINLAVSSLEELKAWDAENSNIYIVPDDNL